MSWADDVEDLRELEAEVTALEARISNLEGMLVSRGIALPKKLTASERPPHGDGDMEKDKSVCGD